MNQAEKEKAYAAGKLPYISSCIQEVKEFMEQKIGTYQRNSSTLYWTSIKVSNYPMIFQETDRKLLEQLSSYSEKMMICAEQISNVASNILEDIHRLNDRNTFGSESYYNDMCILEQKLNILLLCEKQFITEDKIYTNNIKLVKEILVMNHKKVSDFDKLKSKFRKYIRLS